jgi:ABC-type polysaccharide/polyol phosphate transport system ATPase subunit
VTPSGPPDPSNPVIRAVELAKSFRRTTPGYQLRTLKSALFERDLISHLRPEDTISALADVSFEVGRGEAFGVIGGNGCGKSTLLKLVAGILRPTRGRVEVDGRVAALIELGAGFHPEISGRENVYINGAVLGLSRAEVARRFDAIVEFAGLGDLIDEPVKNYSSGMYVRLGFAVAVHTEPDVLLVDEVLAVGDEAFAHRCLRRIAEMLAQGKTLLFVSHALAVVEEVCDRVLWLDRGRPRLLGSPRRVCDAYRQAVAEEEGEEHRAEKETRAAAPEAAAAEPLRWGSGAAEILAARLLDAAGRERYHFQSGEELAIEIRARAREPLADFVFGVALATPRGVECWGTNTELAGFVPARFAGEAVVRVRCPSLRLGAGEYTLDVAVHARNGAPYDYRRKLLGLTVTAGAGAVGLYLPEHRWEFAGGVDWSSPPRPGVQ